MKDTLLLFFKVSILLFSFLVSTAQELPTIVPPSPEAAALGKFTEVPISHYTGVPNISVPITSFTVGNKTFPVSINYHARGIQVSEIASRVGLGWTLNAGGQITRQQRDMADDSNYGIFGNAFRNGFTNPASFENNGAYDQLCTNLNAIITPEYDKHPDIYNIQLNGLSAKFIFDFLGNDKPLLQKYDDIIINELKNTSGIIVGFEVIDKEGYIYSFVSSDMDTTLMNYQIDATGNYIQSNPDGVIYLTSNTWHLNQVESPNGEVATFLYIKETSNMYRRSYDEYFDPIPISNPNDDTPPPPAQYFNHSSKIKSEQYQLSEIRYDYNENDANSYKKIVFEPNNNNLRQDVPTDGGGFRELNAIKIYDNNDNLIKTFDLSHSYISSTDANDFPSNYHNTLVSFDPTSSKRLFLNSITEIGRDGSANPPHIFTYNPQPLPNRFSNSQDFWGYYNGAANGQFLDFFNNDRKIDTTLSQAGMLEKITYPTGGSTRLTYEHNRGVKGNEYNNMWFPKVNPSYHRSEGISTISGDSFYDVSVSAYVKEFEIGTVTELVTFTTNLPGNQDVVCEDPGNPNCEFAMSLERIHNGIVVEMFTLKGGTEELLLLEGTYRLTVDPDDPNWQLPPPQSDNFIVSLTWDEQIISESEVLYTSGKRIKAIEYLDSNDNVVSTKEYSYKTENGNESGVVLGVPNFLPKHPEYGDQGGLLPGPASPGGIFTTYQGNTTGYGRVTEYYGDASHNIGKTVYNFTNIKDSGDPLTHPVTPPTDNEWLRGMPYKVTHYRNSGNDIYKKVKENRNQYSYAGITFNENIYAQNLLPVDFVYTPESLRKTCGTYPDPSLDLFYEKNDSYFRIPLIHFYITEFSTIQYKIYHFTGGTVDQWYADETLYDDNENVTLVTQTETEFNYDKHYQPSKVTSVTSDGIPVIQTFTFPQNIDALNRTVEEQDLVDQNRLVALETRTYKDENQDGYPGFGAPNELKSTTKTIYDWFSGNTVLEPSLVQTAKGDDALENRIEFKKYDEDGNVLEVSKADGTNIVYIYGYDNTLPVAKIENATYAEAQPFIYGVENASDGDNSSCTLSETCDENTLRLAQENLRAGLPNAMVSTYTYDPLIGVTSMTDPRGYTTYYEYDEFNRLKWVKDEDGNILSKNDYNYKPQN